MTDEEVPDFLGNDALKNDTQFNPLTGGMDDDYTWKVRMMVEDARTYNDDFRARRREVCMEYYAGLVPELDAEGRSTIVATEARDTILSMLPSLLRIFTAREHVCEFQPRTEQAVPMAEQATEYVEAVLMEDNDGFLILHNWIKDALTKGEGATTWWTDNHVETREVQFRNASQDQLRMTLMESEHAELVSLQPSTDQVPQLPSPQGDTQGAVQPSPIGAPQDAVGPGPELLFDAVVRYTVPRPRHVVEGVPPDEFRVDRFAKSVRTAILVGHESVKTPGELRALGYPEDVVDEFSGQDVVSVRWNLERTLRNPALDQGLGTPGVYDGINYGSYYIRVDKDGDGIAELRHICTMGNADIIVHDEPADVAPYAFLTPDPEPHTLIGHSMTELVEDLQRIKTNLLRNSLDSIANTIYPRLVFNEALVNPEDVMSDELGAPIRAKDPQAIQQLSTQLLGEAPMAMIQYLDLIRTQRTGVSDASKGLDPKALQSTAVKGVDMVVTGAQERIELVARIFAETGFKDMFKGLLRLVTNSPNPGEVRNLRGQYVEVQPSLYDADMPVRANPALGRSSDSDRMVVLQGIKATQEGIITSQGVTNPMVTPTHYRNTLEDILSLGGMKNVSRYFGTVTPEQMQAMANAPKPPTPQEALVQSKMEEIKAKVTHQIAVQQFLEKKHDDDEQFRRDKLVSDTMAKELSAEAAAKMQLNTGAIEAQIEADRNDSSERIAADRHATQRAVAASRQPTAQPAPAGAAQ